MSSLATGNYSASLASSSAAAGPFTLTVPKPCSTAELADALVDRIMQVQRRHYRETGKKLSYADAITELGNIEDADLDSAPEVMPTKRLDLAPVKKVLAGMHYTPRCNAAILETICRTGTVECGLKFLTDADRQAIEAAIPEAPEEAWKGPKRKGLVLGDAYDGTFCS